MAHFGIGGSGAGYLTATHGAGAVAGALASFALVGRARLVPVMVGAALLAAIAFLLLGIEMSILVAFRAMSFLYAGLGSTRPLAGAVARATG